jgi:hypothetical protein
MQAGRPADRLVAWLGDEPGRAEVVARFARSYVLRRRAGRLVAAVPTERGPFFVVIVHGVLVRAGGRLAVGELTIGPALRPRAVSGWAPGTYRLVADLNEVVTAALLRHVSPDGIVAEAVEYLRRHETGLRLARRLGADLQPSEAERAAWKRLGTSPPRRRPRISDDELRPFAHGYLALVGGGQRAPLVRLAADFGISREQARDRLHLCRKRELLGPGTVGRAGAAPGPRL